MTARRAAVAGSPIVHSLSPVLHRAAYSALGLDWTYEALDVGEDQLAGLLGGLDDSWAGLSLTMPLKRAVLPLLAEVTPLARAVGAANTVLVRHGRRDRLLGDNTDVPGMVAALREAADVDWRSALVLGGGATAASALAALAELGVDAPLVAVRDLSRTGELLEAAQRIGSRPELVGWADCRGIDADLVVSTVPTGATSVIAASLRLRAGQVLFDVVYDPWPTPLASAAAAAGAIVVGGLDLLVHQGALQVELMTGQPAPLAQMQAAARAALAERAQPGGSAER